MYFYYGITHSSLEEANHQESGAETSRAGNIELTVTDPSKHQQQVSSTYIPDRNIYEGQQLDAFGQPVFGSTSFGGGPSSQQKPALFVTQDSFPTWDD